MSLSHFSESHKGVGDGVKKRRQSVTWGEGEVKAILRVMYFLNDL